MSKAEKRAPFEFEGALIKAGKKTTVEMPVSRLPPGNWTSMPVVVIHGKRPGPTLWLSGALHGDELNGILIVRRLSELLRPSELSGTVLAVPIVNVIGVTMGSRYLPDRRDLNRSFPGSARGSMTSRLAHLFFDRIVARSEYGMDFHCGSAGRDNMPQVRGDLQDERVARLADAFAAPFTLHAATRDGSLREAARERGVPVLLFEGGEAQRVDPRSIATGVRGAQRVMHALGMLDAAPADDEQISRRADRSVWVRANRSGFFIAEVDLGEFVLPTQVLGHIVDSVGRQQAAVRAKTGGAVIGILRTALVHRGDALFHIGEVDP